MMGNSRNEKYWWLGLFILGTFIELIFQTSHLNELGQYYGPVLILGGGILTCIAAFFLIGYKSPNSVECSTNRVKPLHKKLLGFGIFTSCSVYFAFVLHSIFLDFPVDAKIADIVPSLEVYVKRFLGPEVVYKPIPFEGYEVNPTYLPLLWMPYAFSEILAIDYRWTAYLVFLVSILGYLYISLKNEEPVHYILLKAIAPFVVLYFYVHYNPQLFGFAVELLPVGFYIILCLSVCARSKLFIAVGILLCLLSRYAFTFWLPVYLLILLLERGFKPVFTISSYVLLGVLLIYVLPFLAQDWSILSEGLAYYDDTAIGQWNLQSWQEAGDKPHHLNKGLSFAIYFYDMVQGTAMERLAFNKKIHILICGLLAIFIFGFYYLKRQSGLDLKWYLIIALKLYLCFFYGFFYVPFSYLYMLPMFLTVPLIFGISSRHMMSSR